MNKISDIAIKAANSIGFRLHYNFPFAYDLMIQTIHRRTLERRYDVIIGNIEAGDKVFDVGCGTCLILNYLDESVEYIGFDLNDRFLRHAEKKYGKSDRKIKLLRESCFKYDKYPESDVIIISDFLHHVYPRHVELLKNAVKRTKKVIVCEPIGDMMGFVYSDYDGINLSTKENGPNAWKMKYKTKEDLIEFFEEMGAKETTLVGSDVIALIESS